MKKPIMIVLFILIIGLMSACKGSDTIQGTWYAANPEGEELRIQITENELTIITGSEEEKHEYKQNAIGTENGLTYYGLTIEDIQYSVIFPIKGDKNIALFMETTKDNYLTGTLVYALNKAEKPDYVEYGAKYLQ